MKELEERSILIPLLDCPIFKVAEELTVKVEPLLSMLIPLKPPSFSIENIPVPKVKLTLLPKKTLVPVELGFPIVRSKFNVTSAPEMTRRRSAALGVVPETTYVPVEKVTVSALVGTVAGVQLVATFHEPLAPPLQVIWAEREKEKRKKRRM